MLFEIGIVCFSICDLRSVDCRDRISRLQTGHFKRHSRDQRFYCHGRSIRAVKSKEISHRYIWCILDFLCLAVTAHFQYDSVPLFQFIQIAVNIQILRQVHMISIVLCNNISGFKPCRFCCRVLLDIHDLCRIITDKSYNDHGQNKCKNKIKYRSCCHYRDSRPDRGCIKRSRKLFLRGILTDHRAGTAQRQQFHGITCFSLLDTEQPWSHAK